MKLRRRDRTDRPGLIRTARVDRKVDQLVARARPGEIAVIDVIDLDRTTAEQLVAAGVSAVVNAAPSCSGRFPVRGPQTLLEAGVLLVDDVGGEVFARVRDGDTVRLDGAAMYAAGEQIVEGRLQSDETVALADANARDGLRSRLGALVADAGRRLAEDNGRLLEGDGFPPLVTDLDGRVVVVVTAAARESELRDLRRVVRRRSAVVVAVGAGADLARAAGLRPDLVVVGSTGARPGSLAKAGEVLVLDGADLDVPVPAGVPRGHAASLGSPEDTAILLAHTRGASLVVTCGIDESLGGVLDRSAAAGSVPLLGRMRGGGRHVAATSLESMPRRRRVLVPVVIGAAACLVAGVALGAGPLDSTFGGDGASTAASPELTTAQRSAAEGAAFEAAVVPALVGQKLTGHAVSVVVLPGATVPAGLDRALKTSGAAVTGPIVLDGSYVDPGRTRVLRDLAVQVAPPAVKAAIAAQPPETLASTQLDVVLASALMTKTASDLGRPDPGAATVLAGLSRIGALTVPVTAPNPADLVVVVAPPNADPAVAARGAALAAALGGAGRGVVVVTDGSPGVVSGGTVGAVRGAPGAVKITTVDDVAAPSGQVAAVLALASGLNGLASSHYGSAADAVAVLPASTGSGTAPSP